MFNHLFWLPITHFHPPIDGWARWTLIPVLSPLLTSPYRWVGLEVWARTSLISITWELVRKFSGLPQTYRSRGWGGLCILCVNKPSTWLDACSGLGTATFIFLGWEVTFLWVQWLWVTLLLPAFPKEACTAAPPLLPGGGEEPLRKGRRLG